jgi:hypothetical protein
MGGFVRCGLAMIGRRLKSFGGKYHQSRFSLRRRQALTEGGKECPEHQMSPNSKKPPGPKARRLFHSPENPD